jgi:hypothetical protein
MTHSLLLRLDDFRDYYSQYHSTLIDPLSQQHPAGNVLHDYSLLANP